MPMRDRMNELKQQRKLLDKGESKPGREVSKTKMDESKLIQAFLSDATKIKDELARMSADVAEIKKLQQFILTTAFPDKKDVGKYESIGEKVRLDATKIGTSLKQLESKNYDANNLSDSSTFALIRTQQLNTLTTEFNISTNEYFRTQAEYMDKMKTRIRKQLSARGDTGVDDSKINAVLQQDSYSVFTDNYIADVNDAEQTLRDIEERKKAIFDLEKSVTDVNHLFKEINLLIFTQGENIMTINSAVENTVVHVETGVTELEKTRKLQRRARRRKFCICSIVLIILVIIGIIVAASLLSG